MKVLKEVVCNYYREGGCIKVIAELNPALPGGRLKVLQECVQLCFKDSRAPSYVCPKEKKE